MPAMAAAGFLTLAGLAGLAGLAAPSAAAANPAFAQVSSGGTLAFPTDYGSHPKFRTEWWYVTGWLATDGGEPLGFQLTFFRTKTNIDEDNPSSFAPRQLLIAHCAISDPAHGRLWQDQRIRRAGFGLVEAATDNTDVRIDRWSLKRNPTSAAYGAKLAAEDFSLDLTLIETQGILLHGDAGVSRKGPAPEAASYYYSLPHLKVGGAVTRRRSTDRVTGEAWLDHEWSSEYLDPKAVGWDWVGLNLADGAALMAFRMRGEGGGERWAGGTYRGGDGRVEIFTAGDIEFRAVRRWTSPRTRVEYPVQWHVRAGSREFDLEPLLDDQENDTRLSTGAVYWEGAVRAYDRQGFAGRGYLELTGYGERLRLTR